MIDRTIFYDGRTLPAEEKHDWVHAWLSGGVVTHFERVQRK